MSGDGPDSIPTSADPRSRRPVKKRALTPVSAQAATLDALFARPGQDVRIPPGALPQPRRPAPPPEIVSNIQGSSAGAGSGEFHVYKASRRREYERLRLMDLELRREDDAHGFVRDKTQRDARDDDKTRRNRERRAKKLAAKAKARAANPGGSHSPAPLDDSADADGDGAMAEQSAGGSRVKASKELLRHVRSKESDEGETTATAATADAAGGLLIHDDDDD